MWCREWGQGGQSDTHTGAFDDIGIEDESRESLLKQWTHLFLDPAALLVDVSRRLAVVPDADAHARNRRHRQLIALHHGTLDLLADPEEVGGGSRRGLAVCDGQRLAEDLGLHLLERVVGGLKEQLKTKTSSTQ